jgi:hypothetical protein
MKFTIMLEVDIDDLDIDYELYEDSLTTEAWGIVRTDKWVNVEINSVTYDGNEVEFTDSSYEDLQNYLIDNINDDYDGDYDDY